MDLIISCLPPHNRNSGGFITTLIDDGSKNLFFPIHSCCCVKVTGIAIPDGKDFDRTVFDWQDAVYDESDGEDVKVIEQYKYVMDFDLLPISNQLELENDQKTIITSEQFYAILKVTKKTQQNPLEAGHDLVGEDGAWQLTR